MNKILKRTLCVASVICLLCGMTVSAEWEFAGYDTTNPDQFAKLYNEKIAGSYTSKHKSEPVAAEDVEWKFEGYEVSYPHSGYERLYLEGNAQKSITRLVPLYPQWDVRFRDYLWEVCGEHRIYERQQTMINNKYWAWDFGNEELGIPDSTVFVPTNRFADVTDEWKIKGVANLDTEGNYVFDVAGRVYNDEMFTVYSGPFDNAMPNPFNVVLDEEGNPTKEIVENDLLSLTSLSEIDPDTGKFAVTDEMIAEYIDITSTKYTTGPSFHGEDQTKDVAKMYVENIDRNWTWDGDVSIITHDAVIEWTTPIYEMAEPYNYYQYLIVNGLVLDGHADTPSVRRYTGGKADPDVEWKYAFAQSDYPYEVIEVKYIRDNDGDMVMAVENGEPVVRIPTGEYANSYFVVTDTDIEVWIKDDVKDYKILSVSRVDGPFVNDYEGFTNGAAYID